MWHTKKQQWLFYIIVVKKLHNGEIMMIPYFKVVKKPVQLFIFHFFLLATTCVIFLSCFKPLSFVVLPTLLSVHIITIAQPNVDVVASNCVFFWICLLRCYVFCHIVIVMCSTRVIVRSHTPLSSSLIHALHYVNVNF